MLLQFCRRAPAILVMIALALLVASAEDRPPIQNHQNGLTLTRKINNCTLIIGFDYRMELAGLFQNWAPEGDLWEDPSQVNPKEMLPLRQQLLKDFEPYRSHAAVASFSKMMIETPTSPGKNLMVAGNLGEFQPEKPWMEFVRESAKSSIKSPDKYVSNISDWVREMNAFVEETAAEQIFNSHELEYRELLSDVLAMSDDGKMIYSIASAIGFDDSTIYITPSVFINPGRNYATDFTPANGRQIGIFSLGPYKEVEQSIFRAHSYNESPVTFNDRNEFILECLHEMIHLLLSEPLYEAVGGREAEYEDLLKPLEPYLKDSYGELKGHGYHYLEEITGRAFTLEYVRRYAGDVAFRKLVTSDVRSAGGYPVLLWRYLYRQGIPTGDRQALVKLLAGIPEEIRSWNTTDVSAFVNSNEFSSTLSLWMNAFLPTFYAGSPQSFQAVFDEKLPSEWRTRFMGLLSERLGVPADMKIALSEEACPFPLVVRLEDAEQFAKRIAWSGLDLAEVRKQAIEASGDADALLFTIVIEPKADSSGVRLCWDVLSPTPPPAEKLVPYYFVGVTHVLAAGDAVLAQDALTRETRLVSGWLK